MLSARLQHPHTPTRNTYREDHMNADILSPREPFLLERS